MSLTYTLRRWLDPSFATDSEQAEQQRVMEQSQLQALGDGFEEVKFFHLRMREQRFRCRECGFEGRRGDLCTTCLADTMQWVR